MNNLPLIIKREFISRVRNKTFIIMTFLSPIILIGMIGVISWLTTLNNDEIREIALVDKTGLFVNKFVDTENVRFINYSSSSLNDAKDSVVLKNLYGLLYIPLKSTSSELSKAIQFYSEDSPNPSIINPIEDLIAEKLTNQNFKREGFDLATIENSRAKVTIQIENFTGEKTSKMSNYVKMFFGGAAGYLLFMFIIIYGNMVMRSVIEEKSNRIIEIIISSVKPMQLMMGKILGTSFAGMLQFLIWVILGGTLLIIASTFFEVSPAPVSSSAGLDMVQSNSSEIALVLQDILRLPLVFLVCLFFVYFIGGYFLYSSIYAAIGAAVDSETDSQQFMMPVLIPLMLGIYVGFFSVIENPHGTVSTIFSMIPLTSPVVMLMRIPFGVAWYEILISVIILFGSVIFMTWFAGRIYRVGILMYGKKASYKEIWKWLKY
ncbi:ABC transporter permease [Aquimarina sp. W85]|uniref:ABC transporter permease n=1 Tax=Aquimarina rhodophyticola TaxID=3342246 RepID=UPI003670AFA8